MKIIFKNKFKFLVISLSFILSINSMAMNLDGKSYKVKSKFSQECMELENNKNIDGIKVKQYPCQNDINQEFLFKKNSDGYYTIATKNGKKLTLKAESFYITISTKGSLFNIKLLEDAYTIQEKNSKEYVTSNVRTGDIIKSLQNNQYNQMWIIQK